LPPSCIERYTYGGILAIFITFIEYETSLTPKKAWGHFLVFLLIFYILPPTCIQRYTFGGILMFFQNFIEYKQDFIPKNQGGRF
jgi:hypothetical protein